MVLLNLRGLISRSVYTVTQEPDPAVQRERVKENEDSVLEAEGFVAKSREGGFLRVRVRT